MTIMIYDLQKASPLKRASAWRLDVILLVVLACGIGMILSAALNYDQHSQTLAACYEKYEKEYGIDFDVYAELTEEEQARYEAANAALQKDQEALLAYSKVVNLSLTIVSLSIFLSYLGLEFGVPLLFGNGQTIGKKVFGIGLMRVDGVKVTTFALFVRTVLGKYTIETMIPVLMAMMIFIGLIGILGPAIILGLLILQIALIVTSKTNSALHDHMAATVAVDLASQMISNTPEDLMEYKKQVHAEQVKKQTY
jgi:uncharacterized RDD family membrane protein YckC